MIGRLSKLLSGTKNAYFIATPKPPAFKPKLVTPKAPALKPKKGQLSLSVVAERLHINQQALRKQLLNPKTNFINEEELSMLRIINGQEIQIMRSEISMGMKSKSPVVTIMGHVDHGKTTLIDYYRKSKIAEGEVGGITQKIGAFHITCHGEKITFIDTPGHEAFSNMRRRGALVTDLIVLIVASTQGVKKQTLQVIDLINKDKIPTIVAISKIDLPNADIQGVEQELFDAGLNIEPKGGDIQVIHISAKTGQNVDLLSELILEETRELKAAEAGLTEGIVLQAYQNEQGQNAMTLIVKQGTLKTGSLLIIGGEFAKVKNMQDDSGKLLHEAKPGDAVQIIGIPNIPTAGDFIYEVEDESKARYITNKRKQMGTELLKIQQDKQTVKTSKIRLDYKNRKKMYGSATNDAWISKFNEKQQQIVAKIEELKEMAISKPQLQEIIAEKEIELKNHKEYVYQFLVNIGQNKNNFNVILKFSDRGIEETILQQIEPIMQKLKKTNSIITNILKSDVGEVTTTDLQEASTCSAAIFTFGAQVSSEAANSLDLYKITPKTHRLIHTFLKDFEESALNRMKVSIKGVEKGRGLVADIFPIKGKKADMEPIYIPGVRVESGKLYKTNKFYVFRNGTPVSDAVFAKSIKSFKKQMNQVKKGDECTITLDIKADFKFEKGDQIVAFQE